ncbi:Major Facilitator Superfamily/Sugar transporter [Novymonas esmeraldas]|uniref:Major Facilitator Superfamily/Sugar transporter n=1 Tax=Novymonas esmeraldas TaxID=1808958 RepID=A0AAW0F6F3_9TRYP
MKGRRSNASFYTNMAILSAVLVSESLSATLMMPFVGLFVAHLEHIPPSEAGYLSGLLISVFQLGQMLTGKLWGTASDRVGRKPMILMGLLANAVVSIFFGMSPNLTFCIVARFIHGCANGNVLVAKTVIADITDKDTEGMGFAAISIFWGVGSVVGPALGGYLYDPTHHDVLGPLLFPGAAESSGHIFAIHPALLPCLVISVFSTVTLLLISQVLPETSQRPVDPFLSLFFPIEPRHIRPAEGQWRQGKTAAEVAVLEDRDDEGGEMGDEGSSASVQDHAAIAESTNWPPTSAFSSPQLVRKKVASANPLAAHESVNRPTASKAMTRDYQRSRHDNGDGAGGGVWESAVQHGNTKTPTSRLHSRSSSTSPLCEPRRRKGDGSHGHGQSDAAMEGSAILSGPETLCKDGVGAHKKLLSDAADAAVEVERPVPRSSAPVVFGYREAFALPTSRNVMIIYMCIASTESALLEIIPLWAISEREKGGLGLASADIGVLLCISSVVYVAVNLVFSRILKCLGGATRPLWDFSVLLWCVTSILTPCCAYVTDRTTMFYAAAAATSAREIGLSWSYSIMFMYVVRSAPDECAGCINGIAQSIASFSRMVTMLVIPPIFAWSLNGVAHPFPFNFHFVFWVTCLPLLLSFAMSSFLPVRVSG